MSDNLEIKFSSKFLKGKGMIYLILFLILILGLYFRYYHADYPVVGYHNWKETHYLTESRNFAREGFTEHGFFIPARDYMWLDNDPDGAHTDSFPTISIIIGFLFKIFGESLLLARFVNILFSLGSIVVFYLVVKDLFKREDLAIISAAVFAINPLSIFFGRQVQLLNPALFFSLLGIYFYIKYYHNGTWKNTLLFSIFVLLGILTKYSFVLFAVPIILTYPYKRLKDKSYHKKHLAMAVLALLSFWWVKYSASFSQSIAQQADLLNIGPMFQKSFWLTMLSFVKDNYTLLAAFLFLGGIIFWFFLVRLNKKSLGFKFMTSYLIGALVWILFMAEKLLGHNYHQYPLLPLFVFFTSFFILSISNFLAKIVKFQNIKTIIAILIIIILLVPSVSSKNRMFDTQFIGLDVAGEYIKEHSSPDERIIHSGHQDYGVIWHADRKALDGGIPSLENIQAAEENFNVKWIFVYQWGFDVLNKQEWSYISQNYALKQIAFRQTPSGLSPIYLVLQEGGSFDINQLDAMLDGITPQTRVYEFSSGTQDLVYFNLD